MTPSQLRARLRDPVEGPKLAYQLHAAERGRIARRQLERQEREKAITAWEAAEKERILAEWARASWLGRVRLYLAYGTWRGGS